MITTFCPLFCGGVVYFILIYSGLKPAEPSEVFCVAVVAPLLCWDLVGDQRSTSDKSQHC